ncbi:peptidoglycan DD-metalloendopeptidase family protein [Candidatus Saccharibacteria bacterium]|nr:peptidoglycan DD-metalloendopeptidase family protein [Candidatus Saccharibacteria bacterium]
MNIHKTTRGFAFIEILLVIVVISAVVGVGLFVVNKKDSADTKSNNSKAVTSKESESAEARIKHLGVNLDYYDEETNKAGDFEFTKQKIEFSRLFFEYGFTVPANSVGPEKKNPQPTFILPLGSKVYSLVDGEVFDVPKLYSNDYSVQVQGENSDLIFETEHVINVLVKKGDKVKAGDVIAEVSDYDAKNYAGLGLVEIGILKGGNPPSHVCPFDYLDASIKDETLKKISALQKSWEEYLGDDSIYNEDVYMPGCVISDSIEG